jgi:Ribbon-helix-helix protein, copG family
MSASQVGKLDELADRMGLTRSQLLRRVVDDAAADMKTTSKRLTEEEALHEQARGVVYRHSWKSCAVIARKIPETRVSGPRAAGRGAPTLSELVEFAFRSPGRPRTEARSRRSPRRSARAATRRRWRSSSRPAASNSIARPTSGLPSLPRGRAPVSVRCARPVRRDDPSRLVVVAAPAQGRWEGGENRRDGDWRRRRDELRVLESLCFAPPVPGSRRRWHRPQSRRRPPSG